MRVAATRVEKGPGPSRGWVPRGEGRLATCSSSGEMWTDRSAQDFVRIKGDKGPQCPW